MGVEFDLPGEVEEDEVFFRQGVEIFVEEVEVLKEESG